MARLTREQDEMRTRAEAGWNFLASTAHVSGGEKVWPIIEAVAEMLFKRLPELERELGEANFKLQGVDGALKLAQAQLAPGPCGKHLMWAWREGLQECAFISLDRSSPGMIKSADILPGSAGHCILCDEVEAAVKENNDKWIRDLGCPSNRARDEAIAQAAEEVALKMAATHQIGRWHDHGEYWLHCSCGWKGPTHKVEDAERDSKEHYEHILSLTPSSAGAQATWSCGNGDHACNLRGYCVNPNCTQFRATTPAPVPASGGSPLGGELIVKAPMSGTLAGFEMITIADASERLFNQSASLAILHAGRDETIAKQLDGLQRIMNCAHRAWEDKPNIQKIFLAIESEARALLNQDQATSAEPVITCTCPDVIRDHFFMRHLDGCPLAGREGRG